MLVPYEYEYKQREKEPVLVLVLVLMVDDETLLMLLGPDTCPDL